MGDRTVFRSHKRRKPSDYSGRTDAEVNETVITQCKEMSPVQSTGKCELGSQDSPVVSASVWVKF